MTVLDHLGFGCVALSTLASPRASRDLLEGVFELGLRHFDTAPIYGRGYSEILLGEFLRGKRDQVSVATKFGMSPSRRPRLPSSLAMRLNTLRRRLRPPARPSPVETSPPIRPPATPRRIGRAELEASFASSCRALGTDHVDLYLLHEEVPSALEPAAVDFLQELRASNRVRQLGLAANGSRYLDLEPADLVPWNVLQYEFGPAWPAHAGLLRRFPAKTHIFHSCLRGVSPTAASGTEPGRVLASCLSANPSGRVLFSSTNLAHVRANLRVIGG